MKRLICHKQNSIKTCSKNLYLKLMLKAIATGLLCKGLRISVTTLNLSPKLGTKILQWCSYKMMLKKENQLSTQHLPFFFALPQNVVGRDKGAPFLRYSYTWFQKWEVHK